MGVEPLKRIIFLAPPNFREGVRSLDNAGNRLPGQNELRQMVEAALKELEIYTFVVSEIGGGVAVTLASDHMDRLISMICNSIAGNIHYDNYRLEDVRDMCFGPAY